MLLEAGECRFAVAVSVDFVALAIAMRGRSCRAGRRRLQRWRWCVSCY